MTVMGGGAFGTALAHVFASAGYKVTLGVLEESLAEEINNHHQNSLWLEGHFIHPGVTAFYPLAEALQVSAPDIVIWAVPSSHFIAVVENSTSLAEDSAHIIASKGFVIDGDEAVFPHVFLENSFEHHKIVTIMAGPTFARGLVVGDPSEAIASGNYEMLCMLQHDLMTSQSWLLLSVHRHVYEARTAIALGAALKTAYAIGAGIVTGAGYGANTQALYFRRAFNEMTTLIERLHGGQQWGRSPAVLGDFFLTATSAQSRNFQFGFHLGEGLSPEEAAARLDGKAIEGRDVLNHAFLYYRMHCDMPSFADTMILDLLADIAGVSVSAVPQRATALIDFLSCVEQKHPLT